MFDLEVFVGPTIVLFGMFIGLLGFAIWGTRAIRESVPVQSGAYSQNMAPLIDGGDDLDAEAAAPLTELALPDIEGAEQLDDEQKTAVNLEKTAEFEQPLTSVNTVASFSQSFWEGQEVATPSQSDYNDAIDRIQAGLDAADAEEFNKNAVDADVIAAADVLEALRHGVVNGAEDVKPINKEETPTGEPDAAGAETSPEKAAAEEITSAVTASEETISEESVAKEIIAQAVAAQKAASAETPTTETLVKETPVKETPTGETVTEQTVETVLPENLLEETDNETTRLISSEEASAILAEEEPADNVLPFRSGDKQAVNELAGNMEETVVMQKIPEEEPPNPNLQRIPPGVARGASSFGFITNQANGMASAVGMNPRQIPDLSNLTPEEAGDTLLPETPIPFGPKMAWLAIPGFKPSEVITALRLDDVQTANWTSGLSAAYADNNQVFVSPSLGGWVLVIGKTLWERADMNRSAENISWLKEICRKFGNACFFSTMRGLGNHGWVGIRDGQIFRAYGYSGELQELIWLVGEPTEEEIAINPGFITEMREKYQPGFRPIIPDEKLVLSVAAAWSVDPGFRRRQYPADFGMVGRMN